jgi:tRNA 2-selenouridine synthase SelU
VAPTSHSWPVEAEAGILLPCDRCPDGGKKVNRKKTAMEQQSPSTAGRCAGGPAHWKTWVLAELNIHLTYDLAIVLLGICYELKT